ncbi:chaperone modulator CbpM [Aquimarina algicola]|uniref:MerR family transcriptional regulator n=1 Tax=Aquimarina algicola TaxID=2589995 RepID=A0A504JFJ3_9FLAO|nr:chaperone modulator CbpM [Aquimarina algicola]TPN87492.1 MerR family transcriptional regulator [Aquimarina algicola]
MTKENLIPAIEFCSLHEIELSFINSLHEFGLIDIVTKRHTAFLRTEELPKLEQFLLFKKELNVNLEGIDIIIKLLKRVQEVQKDMSIIKNRFQLHEKP